MSLKNKVVVITGATSGIGYETALSLARLSATVFIGARNVELAHEIVEKIKEQSKNLKIYFFHLDLEQLRSVREFCRQIDASVEKIDVLINNAGLICKKLEYTVDGFERTFQINHLGHFLLTSLLLKKLKASDAARIINVSSLAHYNSPQITSEFLQLAAKKPKDEQEIENLEKKFKPWVVYSASKLMNILFTKKLDSLLKDTNITSNCLSPGIVATGFSRGLSTGIFFNGMAKVMFANSMQGAYTTIYLASSSHVKESTGNYYANCKIAPVHRFAKSNDAIESLFSKSLQFCGMSQF